jgi:hypothetical protein
MYGKIHANANHEKSSQFFIPIIVHCHIITKIDPVLFATFFFLERGDVFGLEPVSNGSDETRKHLTRCASQYLLSIQK